MPEGAVTVSVAKALPPLLNVVDAGMLQEMPVAAVQVKFTVPVNPLTDVRLIAAVLLLPAATATFEELGISVKSESGLEIGPPVFNVNAEGL